MGGRSRAAWGVVFATVWPFVPVGLEAAGQAADPPRILLDVAPRAVEYQLGRLTADELQRLERDPADIRYRPVYVALLTRERVLAPYRDEALAVLTAMTGTSTAQVLLDALARVPDDDAVTARQLIDRLMHLDPRALGEDRSAIVGTIDGDSGRWASSGAYGALMLLDEDADTAWEMASEREEHVAALLEGVRRLPTTAAGDVLRRQLSPRIVELVEDAGSDTIRVAALEALPSVGSDEATFMLLADVVTDDASSGNSRAAAIRALLELPRLAWPTARIEPLARAMVDLVGATPPAGRVEPDAASAIELGERLAVALPETVARAVRRDLRVLGVSVVRIETVFEEMRYDRSWFVVESGRPVQVVFANRDAMPHNVVIGQPGSLQAIGVAGGVVPVPVDPAVKPYVPDMPEILAATGLLQEGEVERLDLMAPDEPGEYVFLCTFPGHWVRMYGVMLVVPDLEVWEASPTPPVDPMTGQVFGPPSR